MRSAISLTVAGALVRLRLSSGTQSLLSKIAEGDHDHVARIHLEKLAACKFAAHVIQSSPIASEVLIGNVLDNDKGGDDLVLDSDGDAVIAHLTIAPQHGELTFDADGNFVYTPDVGEGRHR